MISPLYKLAGAAAALALCATPTMASAATAATQPVNPLVAVSVFGTPASAQAVSPQLASTTATAGALVAVQGQSDYRNSRSGITGTGWLMIALTTIIAGLGIYTLFHDDDDDGDGQPVSPN